MEVLGRVLSERLVALFKDANDIAATEGKSILFKYSSEHPNELFHTVRGIKARDPGNPTIIDVYLNEGLTEQDFELVAAHELCHILADSKGFGYKYGLTHRVPKQQINLWENIAVAIGECFTHVSVYRSMQDYGFDIHDFDAYVIDELKDYVSQGRRCGTASVAHHAVLHISSLYQEKYSVSTLDLQELETLYGKWDTRILEVSRRVQPSIPDINLLSTEECYSATIAVRNAIGRELGLDLQACIHFFNPQTGSPY